MKYVIKLPTQKYSIEKIFIFFNPDCVLGRTKQIDIAKEPKINEPIFLIRYIG